MTFIIYFSFALMTQDPSVSAEQIIAQFVEAKGGRRAIENIKSFKTRGSVFSDGKKVGEFESYHLADKCLSIDKFSDGATRRAGTDGKTVWRIDINGNPTILSGKEAIEFKRHNSTLNGPLGWKTQFDDITYVESKVESGVAIHRLEFHKNGQSSVTRFFDGKTGFLIREEQDFVYRDTQSKLVSKIGEYRKVGKTMVAFSRLNEFDSGESFEFKVESATTNAIDDMTIFNLPKSVQERLAEEENEAAANDDK